MQEQKTEEIAILMYHEVNSKTDNMWCVSPKNFREQMKFLKTKEYEAITLDELHRLISENKTPEKKSVVITFDDGRKGFYENALPVLKEFGFTATVFVVPDWVSGKNIPMKENYSGFMNWEQVRELNKSGFEVGCHGKTHSSLLAVSDEKLEEEISESKRIIESRLNKEVGHFSFPYGKFNKKIAEKVASVGYKTMVTAVRGFEKDPKKLSRQWVTNKTTIEDFKLLLKKPTISLCMIARNEEKNIERAIKSVKPIVDEIIVVDNGSADRTAEIAKKLGAGVFSNEWKDNFSEARNLSLERATSDWILVLDADEIIAGWDLDAVKELVNNINVDAYLFTTRNYTNDSSAAGFVPDKSRMRKNFAGWHPSTKVRLFKNHRGIKFEGIVHELVESSIKRMNSIIYKTEVPVYHYSKGRGQKKGEYLELAKKKVVSENSAQAYYELGILNKELDKFDDAISAFQKSAELEENNVRAIYELGVVFEKLKRYDDAIAQYQKTVELNPNYSEAYFGLGVCYLNKGDMKNAVRDFETSIKLNPRYISAYNNLGVVFERLGLYDKAIKILKTAVLLNPKNRIGYFNLGVACDKKGDIEKAIQAYERAAKLGYEKEKIMERVKELQDPDRIDVSYSFKVG